MAFGGPLLKHEKWMQLFLFPLSAARQIKGIIHVDYNTELVQINCDKPIHVG